MYKKFLSAAQIGYVYDNCTNNIYQIDDKLLFDSLPSVGETSTLRVLDPNFFDSYYGEEFFERRLTKGEIIAGEPSPEVLVIEVTQQCNFRCEYCIFSGHYIHERVHRNISLDIDTADEIMANFFCGDNYPHNVSFYGGEPLLNFAIIKHIVSSLERKGLEIAYYITSDGSLMWNDEIFDFLIDHKFHINISYDGINQDTYRKTISGQTTSGIVERVIMRLLNDYPEFTQNHVRLSITLAPPYTLYQRRISTWLCLRKTRTRLPMLRGKNTGRMSSKTAVKAIC